MAEVAGLIIGSVQLIDVVLRLKHTFDGVGNLPEQVTDLLQEAEIIATQLGAVETELAQDPGDPQDPCVGNAANFNMGKCVDYCRQALGALYNLATAFESKLSRQKGLRRGIVMAKLFLQKDQLERLQNKLDRAVQLLKWAQSCYVQAQLSHLMQMSRSQHHVVLSAITTLQPISDSSAEPARPESESGDDDEDSITASPSHSPVSAAKSKSSLSKVPVTRFRERSIFKIQSETSGYTLQIQLPTWISEFVWELQAHRACSANTYRVRQYRYTTWDDPAFQCIVEGRNSVATLCQLFDAGKASPFDILRENGLTLQHFALSSNDIETSKFLLSLGAGLDEVNAWGEYVQVLDAHSGSRVCHTYDHRYPIPWMYSEDLRSIGLHGGEDLNVMESQPTFQRAIWRLGQSCAYEAIGATRFRKYRDWLFPNYDDIPLWARSSISRYMATLSVMRNQFRGDTLRLSLSADGIITPEMVVASIDQNLSLLHTFSIAFASQWFYGKLADQGDTNVELTLRELISTSTDLHHCEQVTIVPLYRLFGKAEIQDVQDWPVPTWAPGTPFLTLVRIAAVRGLCSGMYRCKRRVWHRELGALLRRWLSLLASCGVDLQAYGARENALLLAETRWGSTCMAGRFELMHPDRGGFIKNSFYNVFSLPDHYFVYLKDFTYGPEIEDWSMEWDVEMDVDMNLFWDFVEEEERVRKRDPPVYGPLRMPGGWVE